MVGMNAGTTHPLRDIPAASRATSPGRSLTLTALQEMGMGQTGLRPVTAPPDRAQVDTAPEVRDPAVSEPEDMAEQEGIEHDQTYS